MTSDRFQLDYSNDAGVPDFTPIEENLEATCIGGMIQVRKYPTGIKVHQEECRRNTERRRSAVTCRIFCALYPQGLLTVGDVEKWNAAGSRIWVDQYAIKPRQVGVQEED